MLPFHNWLCLLQTIAPPFFFFVSGVASKNLYPHWLINMDISIITYVMLTTEKAFSFRMQSTNLRILCSLTDRCPSVQILMLTSWPS